METTGKRVSEKTEILITELFEILSQGHTQKGEDWLFDEHSRDYFLEANPALWMLAGRWRFEMGIPDPWCSITNTLPKDTSTAQREAVNTCAANKGVRAHQIRSDFGRTLAYDCRGCGVTSLEPVEVFISTNPLAMCDQCRGMS